MTEAATGSRSRVQTDPSCLTDLFLQFSGLVLHEDPLKFYSGDHTCPTKTVVQ